MCGYRPGMVDMAGRRGTRAGENCAAGEARSRLPSGQNSGGQSGLPLLMPLAHSDGLKHHHRQSINRCAHKKPKHKPKAQCIHLRFPYSKRKGTACTAGRLHHVGKRRCGGALAGCAGASRSANTCARSRMAMSHATGLAKGAALALRCMSVSVSDPDAAPSRRGASDKGRSAILLAGASVRMPDLDAPQGRPRPAHSKNSDRRTATKRMGVTACRRPLQYKPQSCATVHTRARLTRKFARPGVCTASKCGLPASMAHMARHLAIHALARIIEIMALGFARDCGANGALQHQRIGRGPQRCTQIGHIFLAKAHI